MHAGSAHYLATTQAPHPAADILVHHWLPFKKGMTIYVFTILMKARPHNVMHLTIVSFSFKMNNLARFIHRRNSVGLQCSKVINVYEHKTPLIIHIGPRYPTPIAFRTCTSRAVGTGGRTTFWPFKKYFFMNYGNLVQSAVHIYMRIETSVTQRLSWQNQRRCMLGSMALTRLVSRPFPSARWVTRPLCGCMTVYYNS